MATKYSFIVVKYPKRETADTALASVRRLSEQGLIKIRDAVGITKTPQGKIKLEQTRDDSIGKGLFKGGLIGVAFAALFGPVGWVAMGAAAGGLFAGFDRGIKNKLLKELGENLTPDQSAMAVLVEHAEWEKVFEHMKLHHFEGELVLSEIVPEDLDQVERLLEEAKTVPPMPEELEIPAPAIVAAVAAEVASEPAREPETVAPAPPLEAAAIVAAAEAAEAEPSDRSTRISDIQGIGPAYAERLAAVGIKTADDLLAAGAKPSGRDRLEKETGISGKLILAWVNKIDLMRIPGIGPQYSDLLEAAGVDSPAELALRNPANLAITVQEVVAARPNIVRRIPTEADVSGWVTGAAALDKVIEH